MRGAKYEVRTGGISSNFVLRTSKLKGSLALVLSGGVARGAAHLGIIKALFERGLKPDIYIGTSVGAVIAAMMAVHDDIDLVIDRYFNFIECNSWLDLADLLPRKPIKSIGGLIDGERMMAVIEEAGGLNGLKLSQTKKPLYIIATDLNSGQEIAFGFPQKFKARRSLDSKSYYQPIFYPKDIAITKALRASIGVPVLFKPYPMRLNRQSLALVDGGIRDNCPFIFAAYLPDVKNILASYLGYAGQQKIDYLKKDITSVFFDFIDISTAFSQLGGTARDAIFVEKAAPSVRIINPGIFSVSPLDLKRSRAVMLSAYQTMRAVLGQFKTNHDFWQAWGGRAADYFAPPRWKIEKLGHPRSNVFCLTDHRSPLDKQFKKKGFKAMIKKFFKGNFS